MSSAAEPHRSGKLRLKRDRRDKLSPSREYNDDEEAARRQERRQERRKRKRKGGDRTSGDTRGSNAGPSRLPNPLFGDDLYRAEKYEAAMREERDWSAKLSELLHDDVQGGFGEFGGRGGGGVPASGGMADDTAWEEEMMRLRGDQFGETQQTIPKRWIDAAQGVGARAGGLKEMDEEEYAEYIREGMYRRKNAKEIAYEEDRARAQQEAETKKQKAREHKIEAKKKEQKTRESEEAGKTLQAARSNWETRWSDATSCRSSVDLPLPSLSSSELTKQSVEYFLFHDAEKHEASKRLRTALLRYHPDRFLSSRLFVEMASEVERERSKEVVEKVAKILSDIINDRRSA
ncbi:hypothetical protein CBS101457_003698 [Exobasidium rhododendri]|nr:hypothetical protein CBS101457_003698 [Exobasidium rhododendri]